jgi:hypothetical protein
MNQPAKDESPLSPHRAFVVQFHAETDLKRGHCAGRVEHVVSGQAAHFQSLEELLALMARVLATIRTPPQMNPSSAGDRGNVVPAIEERG